MAETLAFAASAETATVLMITLPPRPKVERLLAHKATATSRLYLVKWVGKDVKESAWIDRGRFKNTQTLRVLVKNMLATRFRCEQCGWCELIGQDCFCPNEPHSPTYDPTN